MMVITRLSIFTFIVLSIKPRQVDTGFDSCQWVESEAVLCDGQLPPMDSETVIEDSFGGVGKIPRVLYIDKCNLFLNNSLTAKTFTSFGRYRQQFTIFTIFCQHNDSGVKYNSQLILETGAFKLFDGLLALAILYANIDHLPNGLFCDMPNLSNLNIGNNRLSNISQLLLSFGNCSSTLFSLTLKNNLFSTIIDDSFIGFDELETIDLSGNILDNIQVNAFNKLNKLRHLNLNNNRLSLLPGRLFVNVARNLESLDLSRNQFVEDGVYPALDFQLNNLQVLKLGWNRLTTIDGHLSELSDGVFKQLGNLTLLDLTNNSIGSINSSHSLDGLDKLINFGLSQNGLYKIDNDLLTNCCSERLMILDLSGNRFEKLPDLSHHINLDQLNGSYNALKTIDDLQLKKDQSTLFTIDLSHNLITSIKNTTFQHLDKLRHLRLDNNRIDNIEPSSFVGNSSNIVEFETLRLDNNRLTSIVDVFDPVGPLRNLKFLNLSSNQLETCNYWDLPFGLKYLRLANNRLGSIGEKHKYSMPPQPILEFLDLSSNRIETIASNSFPESVSVLLLANNRIQSIEENTFIDKLQLTVIDLSNNNLTVVCPVWFLLERSTSLAPLDSSASRPRLLMAGNPLICNCQLEWMMQINSDEFIKTFPFLVDFDNVQCSRQEQHDWKTNTKSNIKLIEINYTLLMCSSSSSSSSSSDGRQVCPCSKFNLWPGSSECQMLIDNECPPSPCHCLFDSRRTRLIFECSLLGLKIIPQRQQLLSRRGQSQIETIIYHLDGNNLTSLSEDSFEIEISKSIVELYLNASQLTELMDKTFKSMSNLTHLYLQENHLISLSDNVFDGLSKLRFLYLYSNHLVNIDVDAFLPMTGTLNSLAIHSNRLIDLKIWKICEKAKELKYISIAGNPWTCDCYFVKPFRRWLRDYVGVIVDKNLISCVSTTIDGDSEFRLTSVNASNNLCINETAFNSDLPIVLTISISSVIIVGLLFSFCVYYRHEIQVLVYSRYGVRLDWLTVGRAADANSSLHQPNDRLKTFDAFISYSSLDENFVFELVNRLENDFDPPYKLCLHDRNFAGGALITDSIIEAVENSCRTILLLSNNFLNSQWCRFEFRAAYLQMLKDKRNRVIVVLLDQILNDRVQLDREINYYLKTNTYLKWDDRLFWKKLIFSLADRGIKRTKVQVKNQLDETQL